MLDGLRTEFPALSRLGAMRRPSISRESTSWAFLSAIGGGFIVGSIASAVMFFVYPALFPATEPRPEWLSPVAIVQAVAAIVVGAVAIRAGGVPALALYVVYELVQIVAALPGRQLGCERSGGLDPSFVRACDIPTMVVERWSIWLALAIGGVGSRWLLVAAPVGTNRMLRAAGAFGLVLTTAGTLLGVLTIATLKVRGPGLDFAFTSVYLVAELVAGVLAGLVLRRARQAAAVLLALLVVSGLASTLPNVRANWTPNMPFDIMFLTWSGAFAPILGVVGILAGWALAGHRKT